MALKSALVACLCAECAMKFKWVVIASEGTKKYVHMHEGLIRNLNPIYCQYVHAKKKKGDSLLTAINQ
jgi:hypothetical protein